MLWIQMTNPFSLKSCQSCLLVVIFHHHIWWYWVFVWIWAMGFKGGIESFFDPCVNAMGQWPYWLRWVIVPPDLAPSFGVICAHYRYRVILRGITYVRAWFMFTWKKATHAQQSCLANLASKKSGATITHLHTWWQDGRHNRFPL